MEPSSTEHGDTFFWDEEFIPIISQGMLYTKGALFQSVQFSFLLWPGHGSKGVIHF